MERFAWFARVITQIRCVTFKDKTCALKMPRKAASD